jgi:hypothetical protein
MSQVEISGKMITGKDKFHQKKKADTISTDIASK